MLKQSDKRTYLHHKIPSHSIFLVILHQPPDILPVDDVDHRRVVDCYDPGLNISNDDGNVQSFQMVPLFDLCRPCITGNTQRRNDENLADLEGLKHEVFDGRKCNNGLSLVAIVSLG